MRVWEKNGSYDTTFNYTGHKDEFHFVISKPFHSTANPPEMLWQTFTGNMGSGTQCGGTILPVKFKSITAKKGDNNSVLITADVAIENLQGALTIERSYNGRDFETATTLATNDQLSVYTYRDYPEKGRKYVYYRLSGEGKYSAIATVVFSDVAKTEHVFNGQSLSLYYIPVGAKITIYSTAGQAMLTTVATNTNQVIPFSGYRKGMYMVNVESKDGKYSGKFLVQ